MASQISPHLLAGNAFGTPVWLGAIVATTTINNADTIVPFTIGAGKMLLVQATAACHFRAVTSSTGTVTTANGFKLAADGSGILNMADGYTHIAVVGAATLNVFELVL